MTQFLDGGSSLNLKRRSFLRPALIALALASLLLVGCGSRIENQSWPGLSTDGEKLYLANGTTVFSYFADGQKLAWTFPAESKANQQFFAAPSVQEDRVIFGDYGVPGGFFSPGVTVSIYAVENIDDGGAAPEEWVQSADFNDKIVAPPLQVGDTVYIGTADNLVFALDAVTGEKAWPIPFETGHSIWGQPAYNDGVLFVTSMDRSIHALDARSGEELWQTTFAGAIAAGPVLNDDLIYVSDFDSQVHALDIHTGEEQWAAPANNWVWGAPAYADGVVYYADVEGNLFAADASTGAAIWQAKSPGAVQTSPVVEGDKVYVASEGESSEVPAGALRAFSVEDGRELWTTIAPAPLFTTPVVVDEAVVVALQSESAMLIAYDLNTGGQLWTIAPPNEE
jgi:outer membrane protein assembly factor BamB